MMIEFRAVCGRISRVADQAYARKTGGRMMNVATGIK